MSFIRTGLQIFRSGSKEDECPICFIQQESSSKSLIKDFPCMIRLVCGHLVCADCLQTCVKKRFRKCALCRCRVTETLPALRKLLAGY